MIDRIINMVIRQIVNRAVRSGVNAAMKGGSDLLAKRAKSKGVASRRGVAPEDAEIDQDASITQRRRLHPDERKGDNILYPTDDYTDGMQPRR